jgi:hypothetical protein
VEGAKLALRIKTEAANRYESATTTGNTQVMPLSGSIKAAPIAPVTIPAFTATS